VKNRARTFADFGFLPTDNTSIDPKEVRMERRSCDDWLKPPASED
jgi:hypothetical protein